ncbi:MAG: signal recognition particle receptor subunit alpha, partial [Verrucomicrobiae bacterium]|nr:signal recognition particle receptor subunit alpha [Verrucomicrobiae bacterium]
MGLFDKIKAGLAKTHQRLADELHRIVTRSPKLTSETIEELEAALLAADLGPTITRQLLTAVKRAYETAGPARPDVFEIARAEVEKNLLASNGELKRAPEGLTVVTLVGVNGTGKTTTAAKLAHRVQSRGQRALLAACDT